MKNQFKQERSLLRNEEVLMNLDKHFRTGVFCMTLLSVASLSLCLASNAAVTVSADSESSPVVSLGPQFLPATLPDSDATVSSTASEIAGLQRSSFGSMALLLVPFDKKDKKKKRGGDEDEGNWENDHGNRDHEGGQRESASARIVFGERDREIIRNYCSHSSSNLPPGLAKRGGQLPPGLEKQLRRNGQLPPGLQKKVDRCPKELERLLPPLPPSYARVFVGGRGLIVDAQFNIVDIIDLFR